MQPALIIVRVNDQQFDRCLKKSSIEIGIYDLTEPREFTNKQQQELQEVFDSWWNMLIYCCKEYFQCRFLYFISDSQKSLYLEIVRYDFRDLVGYCHFGYDIEYLKYLMKYIISSNTCNEILPTQINNNVKKKKK